MRERKKKNKRNRASNSTAGGRVADDVRESVEVGSVAERARIRRRGLDYSCVLVRGAGKLLVSHPPYSGSTGRGVHLSVPLLCRVRSALQISELPFLLRRRCAPRTWRSRLPVRLSTRRNKRLPPIFGSSGKIVSAVRERCLSRRKNKKKNGGKEGE